MGTAFPKAPSRPKRVYKYVSPQEKEIRGLQELMARQMANANRGLQAVRGYRGMQSKAGASVHAKKLRTAQQSVAGTKAAMDYAARATQYYKAGKMSQQQYIREMQYAYSQAKASSIGGMQTAKKQRQRASYSQGPVQQKFQYGYTTATKEMGYTPTPTGKFAPRREAIKTEAQQAAQAQTAFTETKQKIEAGRAAKAQMYTEVRAPKTEAEQI